MVSDLHTAVTKRALPSTIARPFRWQRSSGTILLMNSGFHSTLKLCETLGAHRQLYLVLMKMTVPSLRIPSSWMSMAPVNNALRGT